MLTLQWHTALKNSINLKINLLPEGGAWLDVASVLSAVIGGGGGGGGGAGDVPGGGTDTWVGSGEEGVEGGGGGGASSLNESLKTQTSNY